MMSGGETDAIEFTIPGRPVPAVRMTQRGKYTKPQAKRYLQYKDKVGWAVKTAGIKPLRGKIKIWITVYLAGGRDGDWDNYAKSICDGLNGIAYRDDQDIIDARLATSLSWLFFMKMNYRKMCEPRLHN